MLIFFSSESTPSWSNYRMLIGTHANCSLHPLQKITQVFCSRTSLLFVNLLIAIDDKSSRVPSWFIEHKFLTMNMIGWSLGLITNLPQVLFVRTYNIAYSKTYISPACCRINFTYVEKDGECIIDTHGETAFVISNLITLLLIALIWVLLLVVIFKAKRSFIRNNRNAEIEAESSDVKMTGYSIARDYSFKIYKWSLQFSIPSLVYSFAFIPSIFIQFYELYNGPINNNAEFALNVWLMLEGLMVAICNLIFYGLYSSSFRAEMKRMFKKLVQTLQKHKMCLKTEQPREVDVIDYDDDHDWECPSSIKSEDTFDFNSEEESFVINQGWNFQKSRPIDVFKTYFFLINAFWTVC